MMKLGWPQLVTVAVTFVSVVAVVLLHYEGLSLIGRTIKARAFHHRAKILMLIFAQLSLHIVEIWMFALVAFVLTQTLAFGAILPVPSGGYLDYVYLGLPVNVWVLLG